MKTYYIGLRLYPAHGGYAWGWRYLGPKRRALDLGRIAVILEVL